MIALTAAEIADITNGRLAAEPGIAPSSVVTDSREATAGSLYVAKPGEPADGHDFVGAAFERGAVLALAEHDVTDADGRNYPAVVVEDAVLAMGALAAEAVRRIRARRRSRRRAVDGHRHHRLRRQDHHQGPAGRHAHRRRPDGSRRSPRRAPTTARSAFR